MRRLGFRNKEAVRVTPLSFGTVFVGAGVMLIAVFLPEVRSNAFMQIEKNAMIHDQNAKGWWFVLLIVLSLGAAYRAYRRRRRTFVPVVCGAFGVALAVFFGTSRAERLVCTVGYAHCGVASAGIGIYAAGFGAVLVFVGGLRMWRAQRIEVEPEESVEPIERLDSKAG